MTSTSPPLKYTFDALLHIHKYASFNILRMGEVRGVFKWEPWRCHGSKELVCAKLRVETGEYMMLELSETR